MPRSRSKEAPASDALYVFNEALRALDRSDLGTKPKDIAHAEAFWCAAGDDSYAAGFVLQLCDGRRAYVDVWIEHEAGGAPDALKVDIEFEGLPTGQKYPRFPSASDPIGGWRHDIGPLNARVRRLSHAQHLVRREAFRQRRSR